MPQIRNNISREKKWRIVFWGVFLSLMVAACANEPVKQQDSALLAQKKFTEAVRFASLNSRPEMYASLREAVRLDPLDARYHWELGRAYFADGDLKNAEKEFQQTIRLNENFSEAFKELGRLYMQEGDLDKAIYYLKEGLKKTGITTPQILHNWIAICYYGQDRFQEAEKEWLEALRIKENENILLNLALAYRDKEYFDKARDSLKRAVLINPRFAPAHYHLALLYLKNKKYELAGNHFEQAVQLDADSEQGRSAAEYLKMIKAIK